MVQPEGGEQNKGSFLDGAQWASSSRSSFYFIYLAESGTNPNFRHSLQNHFSLTPGGG